MYRPATASPLILRTLCCLWLGRQGTWVWHRMTRCPFLPTSLRQHAQTNSWSTPSRGYVTDVGARAASEQKSWLFAALSPGWLPPDRKPTHRPSRLKTYLFKLHLVPWKKTTIKNKLFLKCSTWSSLFTWWIVCTQINHAIVSSRLNALNVRCNVSLDKSVRWINVMKCNISRQNHMVSVRPKFDGQNGHNVVTMWILMAWILFIMMKW